MTVQQSLKNIPTNYMWNILSHNVQGISEKFKKTTLLDYCKENKIDLIGITETWLPPNYHWKDNNQHFKIWLSSPKNQYKGSGVGFILSNSLASHVYNVQEFLNRGMFIELAFKGNIKYRIINIYKPSNSSDKTLSKKLHTLFKKSILEAKNHNKFIIVMGNFNKIIDRKLDLPTPTIFTITISLI